MTLEELFPGLLNAGTAVGEDFFEVDMLPQCEVVLHDGKLFGGVAEGIYGSNKALGQARQDFVWNYWVDPATRAAAAAQPGLVHWNRRTRSFAEITQLGTAFARPGDRLRLIKRDTLLGYADCSVTDITRHNEDYYVLALDKSIGEVYEENSSVENLSTRPDVIFRDNTVRNNRARGMLVTAGGKVLIENNRFERPSMMGVLVEGDNHVWYESGAVEDVTIRRNTFIGHSPTAPLLKLAPMQPEEERLLPPYHHNIRILDNTIEAASPLVIEARRVSGLEVCGNTVTFRGEAVDSNVPAFQLVACEGAFFRENKLSRPACIEATPADSSVRLENNENLRRKTQNE